MSAAAVSWDPALELAPGRTVATLQMSRAQWEDAGAAFKDVSGSDPHQVMLAIGSVPVAGESTRFGVLDYNQDTTYLVAETPSEPAATTTLDLLCALVASQTITPQAVRATGDHLPADARNRALELAAGTATSVPRARARLAHRLLTAVGARPHDA